MCFIVLILMWLSPACCWKCCCISLDTGTLWNFSVDTHWIHFLWIHFYDIFPSSKTSMGPRWLHCGHRAPKDLCLLGGYSTHIIVCTWWEKNLILGVRSPASLLYPMLPWQHWLKEASMANKFPINSQYGGVCFFYHYNKIIVFSGFCDVSLVHAAQSCRSCSLAWDYRTLQLTVVRSEITDSHASLCWILFFIFDQNYVNHLR